MKKKNLIWIFGEAVMNYPGKTAHSKYKIMEELSAQGIEFENMVVTAPSTVMSHASIMTSRPPSHISRTYEDFSFDKNSTIPTLSVILKNNGYNIYTTTYYAEGRRLLKNIICSLDEKDLPKGLKNDTNWSSENLNNILEHLLKKGLKEPFFLLLNYNNQENTNALMEKAITKLKQSGLYDDSIFILCPDHGWPREDWPENSGKTMKRHDTELNDSNILIPFFIRYPDCPIKKIKTLVSSLDIVPTIFDSLGIPYEKYDFCGESILPLLNNPALYKKEKFVTNTRFFLQTSCSICIRDQNYKYLINRGFPLKEQNKEEFYDLSSDPYEEKNLIESNKHLSKIEGFKRELEKEEEKTYLFNNTYLSAKFKEQMAKTRFNIPKDEEIKILLLSTVETTFLKFILSAINTNFSSYHLDLVAQKNLADENINPELLEPSKKISFYPIKIKNKEFSRNVDFQHADPLRISNKINIPFNIISFDEFMTLHSQLCQKKYHFLVATLNNPYGAGYNELKKIIKNTSAKKVILLDYNMNFKKSPPHRLIKGLQLIYNKKNYYLFHPKRLIEEAKNYLSRF